MIKNLDVGGNELCGHTVSTYIKHHDNWMFWIFFSTLPITTGVVKSFYGKKYFIIVVFHNVFFFKYHHALQNFYILFLNITRIALTPGEFFYYFVGSNTEERKNFGYTSLRFLSTVGFLLCLYRKNLTYFELMINHETKNYQKVKIITVNLSFFRLQFVGLSIQLKYNL